MFADASVVIALIVGGDGVDALADRLDTDADRLCSPMSIRETVAGLRRPRRRGVPQATARVRSHRAVLQGR